MEGWTGREMKTIMAIYRLEEMEVDEETTEGGLGDRAVIGAEHQVNNLSIEADQKQPSQLCKFNDYSLVDKYQSYQWSGGDAAAYFPKAWQRDCRLGLTVCESQLE